MKRLVHAAIAVASFLAYTGPSMAQLRVMISGGFSGAYKQVLPEFEKAEGVTVTTLSGASQGSGPLTIASQLKNGAVVDVVILSREGLTELVNEGRIIAGTDADLATVPIGAAVKAGTPKPDVSTAAAFKQALLGAKVIAVPGSTSGIFLREKVFTQLGIAGKINVKVTERGSQAAAMAASGEADIVVQPVSELMNVPGLEYAGRIPDEFQLIQVFASAVVKGSNQVDAGRKLIRFLASDRTRAALLKNGMDPVAK
jgi:molybdate transport system substrate-binding protein